MVKKIQFKVEYDSAYSLIGISCHLKDYRFMFHLNKLMGFDFKRVEDLPAYQSKTKNMNNYSLFLYKDPINHLVYYFIGNRSEEGTLLPGEKNIDFVLMMKGPVGKTKRNKIIQTIKNIPNVLTAYEIAVSSIKDADMVFSDLEIHLVELQKKEKLLRN